MASSEPIESARSPVVISSSIAASFLPSSSFSPLAVSYAIIIPVNAPVPDTSNGQAAITLQFSIPAVVSVLAIIALVTKFRFAVFTLIPPELVGSTYAQLFVVLPICSAVAIPSIYFTSSECVTIMVLTLSAEVPKYLYIASLCSVVRFSPNVTTLSVST